MKTTKNNKVTNIGFLAGGLVISALSTSALAGNSIFDVNPLGSGGEIRSEMLIQNNAVNDSQSVLLGEAKCGESKTTESKCGESKCGEKSTKKSKKGEKGKAKESKCGESKCGEKGKSTESKCGEGKCGGK